MDFLNDADPNDDVVSGDEDDGASGDEDDGASGDDDDGASDDEDGQRCAFEPDGEACDDVSGVAGLGALGDAPDGRVVVVGVVLGDDHE